MCEINAKLGTTKLNKIWIFVIAHNGQKIMVKLHMEISNTAKNTDWSIGSLARPFARSLAPLTRSLSPDCSLRSLCSLPCPWESE